MINNRRTRILRWSLLLAFGLLPGGNRIFAAVLSDTLVINSISVAGTNLNFVATFPAGLNGAALEMRPTLTDPWQLAASFNVPVDGGTVEFAIPLPPLPSAFFRLRATAIATTNAQLSAELQYVVIPALGPDSSDGTNAVFHFKGTVDGSDRILVTREGAFWEHVNWDWPAGEVTINGVQWNPREKNFLTTTGAVSFLPEKYSLEDVGLEIIEGRDVIALEQTNNALIVYLDDTQPGAAEYEFKIHFHPVTAKHANTHASPAATLKIAAQIDGSDSLRITAREATWEHKAWSPPGVVRFNDIAWDLGQTNLLINAGTNSFLPSDVDLSTARIVSRKGRDVGTMWADAEALWIQFADNPNGADDYELELSFGR